MGSSNIWGSGNIALINMLDVLTGNKQKDYQARQSGRHPVFTVALLLILNRLRVSAAYLCQTWAGSYHALLPAGWPRASHKQKPQQHSQPRQQQRQALQQLSKAAAVYRLLFRRRCPRRGRHWHPWQARWWTCLLPLPLLRTRIQTHRCAALHDRPCCLDGCPHLCLSLLPCPTSSSLQHSAQHFLHNVWAHEL